MNADISGLFKDDIVENIAFQRLILWLFGTEFNTSSLSAGEVVLCCRYSIIGERSELPDNLAKLYILNFEIKRRMVLPCSCKALLPNDIEVIDDLVVKVSEECVTSK